jgi:hypothetical protein
MAGAASGLTRVNTALTAVPAGTALVSVQILVDGSTLSIPAGATLTASHLLLEIGATGQTVPSAWADIDVKGNVLDIFGSGSSAGLRTQASTLPIVSSQFGYSLTPTSATISWTGMVIGWPDGGATYVQDGALPAVSGLTASTEYWAFLYWDVLAAQVVAVAPSSALGSPALLGPAYDVTAAAACSLDGRIALTPGGMNFTTPASGTSTGSGGGAGSYGSSPDPYRPPGDSPL